MDRRARARRYRAACIAIGCVLVSCSACEQENSPDFPNVLLISIDTLRADHVGLYGYERDTTPEIDAFFADATLYEHAISPAPCTVPAVRQILSGGFDLAPSRKRLPEILQSHGFRTLASVSQHQFLYDHKAGAYARGFDTFEMQSAAERDRYRMTTRSAAEVTTRGLALLSSWPWQRAPFFLWLHYFDPHDPYEPPAEYRSLDRGNRSSRNGDRRAYLLRAGGSKQWSSAGKIFSEEDVAHFRNLHDGEIQYMDAELGRIFRALEEDNLVEHTIVVLTSDHGEWLGEDDQWDHCRTLNQKELHVPLLIRAPGGKVAGRARETRVASTLDVLPTVLALLEIPLPIASYAGHNLRLPPEPGRRVISSWNRQFAVQDERWKLVVGKSPALYDLSSDPEEQHNVVALHPLQVKRLGEEIAAREDVLRATATQHETIVEQLRAIGYIEESAGSEMD